MRFALSEALERRWLLSLFPAADVNARPAPSLEHLAASDGWAFFAHDDATHGLEVWKSDGTAAGTVLVKDVRPGPAGSEPSNFGAAGGFVFFTVDDGRGNQQLWRTRGTPDSTLLVRQFDVEPGGLNLSNLIDVNGVGFFAVDGYARRVLWKTDGTPDGTVAVAPVAHVGYPPQGPSVLYGVNAGGLLFFRGYTGVGEDEEVWRSDGTAAGTFLVKDLYSQRDVYDPSDFAVLDGKLLFTHQYFSEELWISDGTADGTGVVKDFGFYYGGMRDFTRVGDLVYFRARRSEPFGVAAGGVGVSSPIPPDYSELWVTDGTESGTRLVSVTAPGQTDFDQGEMEASGGALYYTAEGGRKLWKLAAGREPVLVYPMPWEALDATARGLVDLGGTLYFAENRWRQPPQVRRTSLSGDTEPVAFGTPPPEAYGVLFSPAAVSGGRLFIDLQLEQDPNVHPYDGRELWSVSNGDSSVTRAGALVAGTLPSWPRGLVAAGRRAYFNAQDSTGSQTPDFWTTDGMAGGSAKLMNLGPIHGRPPAALGTVGDVVLYTVYVGWTSPGDEIWRSDGTAAGTRPLRPLGQPLHTEGGAIPFNGSLYFRGYAGGIAGLWTSDGTDAGTVRVDGFGDGPAPYPVLVVGGTLFLVQSGTNGQSSRLWKTDGTPDGTVPVKAVGGMDFYAAGNTVFFTVTNYPNPPVLWRTDGTEAGTVPVPAALTGRYARAGGALVFRRVTPEGRPQLWRTDGTEAGTSLLREFAPVARFWDPGGGDQVRAEGDSVFFVAPDDEHGWELWKSDGTAEGTVLVRDVAAGPGGSVPRIFGADGGVLLFTADDLVHGRELWRSDGTAEGTRLVEDLQPGWLGSNPSEVAWAGQTLFVAATSVAHGTEVWALRPQVVARRLSDGAPAGADVDVDASKQALLPGESASFGNVTSHVNGLTRIVIDVRTPGGVGTGLAASDFEFRTGVGGDPAAWAAGPAPAGVVVRPGEGAGGSDRVTLTWRRGAVRNTWLRVTIKPGRRSGLDTADVFFFGSLVGDSGSRGGVARVDAVDVARTRRTVGATSRAALERHDFDRDGRVTARDVLIARATTGSTLQLMSVPATVALTPAASAHRMTPARRQPDRRSALLVDAV